MAKAPQRSKRRLAAEIGERAVEAARHFYACALEDVAGWPGPAFLALAAAADRTLLEPAAPVGIRTVLQPAGNLGERIERVQAELLAAGHARQIFIGVDCPELDRDYLRRAAAALEAHDVVLGPARDGGVVLMGSARPWPALGGLSWSTATLGEELRARCAAAGYRTALLEERGDVDTLADLLDSVATLRADRRPARRALHRWLAAQPECVEP